MKILAFSDLHRSRGRASVLVEASREADLVIAAGDFCTMREGLEDAFALLSGIGASMVAVPGNAESADELRAAAPKGVTVLHGEGAEIGGLQLFGLGYGVPVTPFGAWSCDLTEKTAAGMLAGCTSADILVTHSPPKGVVDVSSRGEHLGSTAVLAAIEQKRSKLVVCGHIHASAGEVGYVGETAVVNAGPQGMFWLLR